MHISEHGHIPIPKKIIKKLGFTKDAPLECVVQDDALLVRRKVSKQRKKLSRGQAFIEQLAGSATIKMTTEEIMRLTRGDDWGR